MLLVVYARIYVWMACMDISCVACVLSSALFFVLFLHYVLCVFCFVLSFYLFLDILNILFLMLTFISFKNKFAAIVKAENSNESITSNLGSLSLNRLEKRRFLQCVRVFTGDQDHCVCACVSLWVCACFIMCVFLLGSKLKSYQLPVLYSE